MSITMDISRTGAFIKTLSDLTGDYTMPSQQQLLLMALFVHGTTNQSDLESMTGVKRSSNSRNISKLGVGEHVWSSDGPGYVESYEDPMNRRTKAVRLTPKGKSLMEECWKRSFGTVGTVKAH